MTHEVWKSIPGVPFGHEISNHGRVRKEANHGYFYLKTTLNGDGNVKVDCGGAERLVGKLVAVAFIGKPKPGYCLMSKDGDRTNNHVDNLKWVPVAEWAAVSSARGFDRQRYGSNNPSLFGASPC